MGCGSSKLKTEHPHSVHDLTTCIRKAHERDVFVAFEDSEHDWSNVFGDKKYVVVDCAQVSHESEKKCPWYKAEEPIPTDEDKTKQKNLEELKERLQGILGPYPKLEVQSFINWGESLTVPRVLACYPETLDELQKLVKMASAESLRIRCAGERHSWGPLFADENQILVYVEKLKSDYPDGSNIRLSKTHPLEVDVMTGVTTKDFKEFQLANKVHHPCNVVLDAVQIVSVVATGCHGVGWDCRTPGDAVVRMRIVDSSGQLKTYTSAEDSQMIKAISANYGLFGIIFDMTLRMMPETLVEVKTEYYPLKDIFHNAQMLKTVVESNWSVELFWFPFNSIGLFGYDPSNDDIWARLINKVQHGPELESEAFYKLKDLKDYLTQEGLRAMRPAIVAGPSLTPLYSWAGFKTLKHVIYPRGKIYQELPHAVHFRRFIENAKVNDMEFVFDFKGDYNKLLKALQIVIDITMQYRERDEFPLNIAMEMRWMAYSESYLCTASIGDPAKDGSGHMFYLEVLSLAGTTKWEQFCQDVATKWIELGGIPHLAKQWDFLSGIQQVVRKKLGDNIEEFKKQLQISGADPSGIFLNDSLKKLLNL